VYLFNTTAGLRRYLELSRSRQEPFHPDAARPSDPLSAVRFTVGLVPTMGALHAGHLSLIQRARQENSLVVVSIFVNPLQFAPQEDLQRYPKTLDADRRLCEAAGVDAVFAPSVMEFYGPADSPAADQVTQVIPPYLMRSPLCGQTRTGHFEGVATVVTKLFNLVRPDRAYFGRKDAQQLAILQRLVRDLNMEVDIVPCPIIREASGLALSSRNQYLSAPEREAAAAIYRSLQRAEALFRAGTLDGSDLVAAVLEELASEPLVKPEYVELVHPQTLMPLPQVKEAGLLAIAARVGSTRLIDNVVLKARRPIIAIDGPAGAGKSTVAKQVARQLDLLYLDTGAMYRAITWLMLQVGVDLRDEPAVAELVSQSQIRLAAAPAQEGSPATPSCRVWINDQEVTQAIRTEAVTSKVSAIAAQPSVRHALVKQQQDCGRNGGIVIDGRDIGTHVFPDAELKLFLTASVHERARRRQQDLKNQGQAVLTLEQIEQAIRQRDYQDSTRAIAPLRKASDAIEIQTDAMSADEVTAQIVALYQQTVPATA